MTSPALASVVVALFEASPTNVTVGDTVSTVTEPRSVTVVTLPAASVEVTDTPAAPFVSPDNTV